MFVFALLLTLHSLSNISVTTYDCQFCLLAPDEPTLECTKTTNIAFYLPLNQFCVMRIDLFPSLVFKSLYFCVFFC